MTEFYVYVIIDPRDNVPFYVGKGQRNRMFSHEIEARSKYWYNKPKCQQINDIWACGLELIYDQIPCEDEHDAFMLERFLISSIGRACNNTGSLTNIHSGGAGSGRTGKYVYQYDLSSTLVAVYESAADAAVSTNINVSTITACCRGEQKSSGDFVWAYNNENIYPYIRTSEKRKPVYQYSPDGKFIATYSHATQACIDLGFPITGATKISAVCLGKLVSYKGYKWSYDTTTAPFIPNKKPVGQFCRSTGVLIKTYESISSAVKSTSILGVSACCNGSITQAGGYIWKFL